MEHKIVCITSVFNRTLKAVDAIQQLKASMPSSCEAVFYIYNSGDAIDAEEKLGNIENVKVIQGDSNIYWSQGIRIALDCYFHDHGSTNTAFIFFNDDVSFDQKILKQWIGSAIRNNVSGIATGSLCVDKDGKITYGGFKKSYSRLHKIRDISEIDDVVALNFNLAMFPTVFIKENYQNTFNFSHGYADLYTSYEFLKNGGELKIFDKAVGMCESNNYHDKYSFQNLYKIQFIALYSDPKYYLCADARKFSKIFGFFSWYVFIRSFLGIFTRWLCSKIVYGVLNHSLRKYQ